MVAWEDLMLRDIAQLARNYRDEGRGDLETALSLIAILADRVADLEQHLGATPQ